MRGLTDSDMEDFDDFMKKVESIDKTIKGMRDGTIDDSNLDKEQAAIIKEQEEIERKKKEREAEKARQRNEAKLAATRKKVGFAGMWCKKCRMEWPKEGDPVCPECGEEMITEESRMGELQAKVEEIKDGLETRKKQRERYQLYLDKKKMSSSKKAGTDYASWDLWVPDDQEEEDRKFIENLPPDENNESFKALEKDIEERAAARKERQRKADEQKDLGNKAFKNGEFEKAVQHYTDGLQHIKDYRFLYTNRAQAYLRLNRYTDAIADCDKLLDIVDIFDDNNPRKDPATVKAYAHRASARYALRQFDGAISDLEMTIDVERNAQRLAHQKELLALVQRDKVEAEAEARVREQAMANADGDQMARSLAAIASTVDKLQPLVSLDPSTAGEGDPLPLIQALRKDLTSEEARIQCRTSGGMQTLCDAVSCDVGRTEALLTLTYACENEHNSEFVMKHTHAAAPPALKVVVEAIGASKNKKEKALSAAAIQLVEMMSQFAQLRPALAKLQAAPRLLSAINPSTKLEASTLASALAALANASFLPEGKQQVVDAGGAVATVVAYLTSKDAVVREKTASVLANFSGDASLRCDLAESAALQALVSLLLAELTLLCSLGSAGGRSVATVENVLGALINASLSEDIQSKLHGMHAVLPLVEIVKLGPTPTITARSMQLLSRVARVDGVCAFLCEHGGLASVIQALTSATTTTAAAVNESAVDGCVRLLALCASKEDKTADIIRANNGISPLVDCLRSPQSNTVGNAALCITNCAKSAEFLQALKPVKAVEALVDVAHKQKGVVQKNAAIALARLATDPENHERIRELHGFEIIYHYVKM